MPQPYEHAVRIIGALARLERWTRAELAEAAGVDRERLSLLVTELHKAGHVHVDEWIDDKRGRQCIAIYTLGPGKDAKKRSALTGKQRMAALTARKKALAQSELQRVMSGWQTTKEVA